MMTNRRAFLQGFLASAGFVSLGGCRNLFAAPAGWTPSGKANLTFGVLSDLHVRLWKDGKSLSYHHDTKTFRKALEYFKSRGVDAVMIAGDLADKGLTDELEAIAKAWYEVFPEGCGVEKIFVYGNHDLDGHAYGNYAAQCFKDEDIRKQHILATDMKGNWERIFHESESSVFMKTVKGYRFIGSQWDHHIECEGGDFGTLLKPFLDAHKDELTGDKPFFYVQHAHLKDTVFGPWAWGHDDGGATAALSAFPNAVAFSGHSHFSETDERAIWQGAFTAVCCSSLRYTGLIDCFRGDVKPDYENGFSGGESAIMPRYDSNDGQQGLLVSVYDDAIVYERHDFRYGRKLGPDWVQMLVPGVTSRRGADSQPPFAFAPRKAKEVPPAFAADATITTKTTEGKKRGKGRQPTLEAIEIRFPAANASVTRPYGYRVRVSGVDGEAVGDAAGETHRGTEAVERFVLAQGYNMPLEDQRAQGESYITLAKAILPKGEKLKVTVEPFSSFGTFGNPIEGSL